MIARVKAQMTAPVAQVAYVPLIRPTVALLNEPVASDDRSA